MPEPAEEKVEENKPSKILEFFSTSVKEPKKEKIKPLTKIVIRRLPPRLTKATFLEEFKLPEHDYFCFVRGDLSMGPHSFSRAYVNFLKFDDIFDFKEKYDDFLLQDEQGKEYHAVVEWAPVQKIPKKSSHQKKSTQVGTIDTDQKYLDFLKKLEEEKNNVGNTSEYFMETEGVSSKEQKVTTTPLLEFLKIRKQQKLELKLKRREAEKERRRKEDEARKLEKLKKVKEKKVEEKSEETADEKDAKGETSFDKKIEGKPLKSETVIKTRVFEKRDKIKKEPIEKKPRHRDIEPKPRREPENKRGPKTPNKSTPTTIKETETTKTFENKSVKKDDGPSRKETKSKFRYSEQRNRDRAQKQPKKEQVDEPKEKPEIENPPDGQRIRRQSTQETSDGSVEGDDKNGSNKYDANSKDPRLERRIRNKDRPAMQIYRPGMGRFSKQRRGPKKDDDASESDEKKSDKGQPEPEPQVSKEEEFADENVDCSKPDEKIKTEPIESNVENAET